MIFRLLYFAVCLYLSYDCLLSNRKNLEKIFWMAGFWILPFLCIPIYAVPRFHINVMNILFFPYNYEGAIKERREAGKKDRWVLSFASVGHLGIALKSLLKEYKFLAWFIRISLFVVLIRFFGGLLKDPHYTIFILYPFQFTVHELGHFVFQSPIRLIMVLGGGLGEILVPLFFFKKFFKAKDYFSAYLFIGWLAYSFFNIGVYAGDARARALTLAPNPFMGGLSAGGVQFSLSKEGHDWYYILSSLGILNWDHFIAGIFWLAGIGCMVICVIGCLYALRDIVRGSGRAVIQTSTAAEKVERNDG